MNRARRWGTYGLDTGDDRHDVLHRGKNRRAILPNDRTATELAIFATRAIRGSRKSRSLSISSMSALTSGEAAIAAPVCYRSGMWTATASNEQNASWKDSRPRTALAAAATRRTRPSASRHAWKELETTGQLSADVQKDIGLQASTNRAEAMSTTLSHRTTEQGRPQRGPEDIWTRAFAGWPCTRHRLTAPAALAAQVAADPQQQDHERPGAALVAVNERTKPGHGLEECRRVRGYLGIGFRARDRRCGPRQGGGEQSDVAGGAGTSSGHSI